MNVGRSAPEEADRLELLGASLSEASRSQLRWQWLDQAIRRVAPSSCDRLRHFDEAGQLRALPEVTDAPSLARASALLSHLLRNLASKNPLQIDEAVSALLTLSAFLTQQGQSFREVAFMMVMVSRSVFGDDRLVGVMERQILELDPTVSAASQK